MKTILGIGAVAIDELLYVDQFPRPEGKVRVRQRIRQCGGLTGTALVAASRLGAHAAYGGLIGDDALSQEVLAGLSSEGVDVSYSVVKPDSRPAYSTIVVDQTSNTRTIFSSAEGRLGPDTELPEVAAIASAGALMIDHHGMEGTRRAVDIACQHGVPVVADFERRGEDGFGEICELVDHLIISHRFATELTDCREVTEAARQLWSPRRKSVVVTCGADGCWSMGAGDEAPPAFVPAFPVNVVDTTGCGDVFHGAYAVGLVEGLDLIGRLRLASATAALKATCQGGQAGIPGRPTVEEFLKRH